MWGAGGGCSPAAKAEHMTKNMPTAMRFRDEGSQPLLLSAGSTSLSFSGISRRMSTASNMVSQAAGNCSGRGGALTSLQRQTRCVGARPHVPPPECACAAERAQAPTRQDCRALQSSLRGGIGCKYSLTLTLP